METKQWVVVGTQVPRKRLSRDDLIEHPANRGATEISALNAKANDPTREHVHHHHDPMAAQEYRFAAKQIDAPGCLSYAQYSSAKTGHRSLLRVDSDSRARGGRCP